MMQLSKRWLASLVGLVGIAVLAVAVIAVGGSTSGAGATTVAPSAAGPSATAAKAKKKTYKAEKAIWGPIAMPDGSSAFPVYQELKVDVYQVQLNWADTASARPADPTNPDDPAYKWSKTVDSAVQQAGSSGIQVAIMVRGTPGWANGGKDASWAPDDAADYAAFLRAAAARYPSVRRWMIWGEPTRPGNFNPMPANSKVGPQRYAVLLDAAYASLKQANASNIVIGGMTWTVGLVSPDKFIKWMKLPNGKPPRLDWYGHNPFSTRFPRLSAKPYATGVRDISDIDTLHAELAAVYGAKKTPKLWLSEFTISSDRTNRAFNFSVSRAEQAKWIAAAFKLADSVPYVAGLGWFDLYDEDPTVDKSLTNGLMTYDGKRKPAFNAYRNAP
jgi:hypothetical protein